MIAETISLPKLHTDVEAVIAFRFLGKARDAAIDLLGLLMPSELISTTECAIKHRKFLGKGGAIYSWRPEVAPYTPAIQDALDDPTIGIVAVSGPGRAGKALALDTPIPTPAGWTTMGEIQIGDAIFDERGNTCRVTFATDVQFGRRCYEVRFSDGSSIVADADHLWRVAYRPQSKVRRRGFEHKVVQTSDMIGRLMLRDGRSEKRFAIETTEPLDLPAARLPIDPYVLGVWLGDGASHAGCVYIHESDTQISEIIASRGYGVDVLNRTAAGCLTLRIKIPGDHPDICNRGHDRKIAGNYAWGQCRACGRMDALHRKNGSVRDIPRPRNTLTKRLRDLNVWDNKHLPEQYLRGSVSQRLDLLRGLLDTDGTVCKRSGRVTFTSIYPVLAAGVHELAISLGFKATIHKYASYAKIGSRRVKSADHWDVSFKVYDDVPVFYLDRKRMLQRPRSLGRPTDTGMRRIIAITEVPSVPVRCIQVDSPTHLFLAGRSMIPTHNTVAPENYMLKIGTYGPPQGVYFFLQDRDAVDDYAEERLEPFFNPDLHPILAGKIGLRSKDNTMRRRRIDGQLWRWLAATRNTLRAKAAPFIVGDEIDGWNAKLRNAAVTLVRNRQKEFGRSAKAYFSSHPDAGEKDGITAIIADSDRRVWYWQCGYRRCRKVSSPLPGVERRMKLYLPDLADVPADEVPDLVEAKAALQCPHCGNLIDDAHRREINEKGIWVPSGVEIDDTGRLSGQRVQKEIAGFTVHGFMLTHEEVTIGKLARAYIIAKRKYDDTGDEVDLREVTVKSLGECYYGPDRRYHVDEWKKVRARLGDPSYTLGVVPDGVRFLVGFVDVQGDRFEAVVIGYDEFGENWLVDRIALKQWMLADGKVAFDNISPVNRIGDWDILIPALLRRRWPLQRNTELGIGLAKLVIDAGGYADKERDMNVTYNARRWVSGVLADGLAKPWEILLTMGSPHQTGELLGELRRVEKDERGRSFDPPVPERRVLTFELKKFIVHRMNQDPPGPLTMHLPAGLEDRYWRELCSEKLIADRWIQSGRNETFDGYVGCEVGRREVMILPDRERIDWDRQTPPYAKPKPMSDLLDGESSSGKSPDASRYDRYARLNQKRSPRRR